MKSTSQQFKVGRLKDRFVVTFYNEQNKRVRLRLSADNYQDAVIEGHRLFQAHKDEELRGKKMTVAEIWHQYENHLKGRPSHIRMLVEAKSILPAFGGYHPIDITEEMVQEYCANRRHRVTGKQVSPGTLWTELGRLRDALRFGVRKRYVKRDDVPYIPRPQKPGPRERWLNDAEIQRLLKATKEVSHLNTAVHLMLATAGRVSAVLELKWDRVDFEGGYVDLKLPSNEVEYRQKNRAHVPMTTALRKVLMQACELKTCEYVVEWRGAPISSIKTAFKNAVLEAGLGEDVTPHSLRHTAAVRMAAAGCKMERIRAYLGHKSIHTTREIYARFAPEHLKDEAEASDVSHLLE